MPSLTVTVPPAARPRLDPRAAPLAAMAVALAGLWWGQGGWVFPLDDAYITLHNADVLQAGRDPNYGVSPLVGATSLVHLALVAGLSRVMAPEAASYGIACAGLLLFLGGLLALARRHALPGPETALLALAGLVTAASQWLNGLETGLALAAVMWLLVWASGPRPTRRLALGCGLLPFLRPELGLLALVLLAHQAWRRRSLAGIAGDAALALAAALPWLAWSWSETGALLPGTLAAKQAFFGVEPHGLPASLVIAAMLVLAGAGPALGALALVRRDALSLALGLFVALFVLGFALTVPEALAQNERRYAVALLPVALFALVRLGRDRGRPMLRLMLAAQCLTGAALAPHAWDSLRTGQARLADHRDVAAWARANLPPDARLLVHDAGMIAYATDLRLTDLVGLKSPDSVADHRRWTAPSGGTERPRALDAIARRAGATHAVILDDRPEGFWHALAEDFRRAGWEVAPLYPAEATGSYRLYRLTPRPAPDSGERSPPR